jgi:hypothetical protein
MHTLIMAPAMMSCFLPVALRQLRILNYTQHLFHLYAQHSLHAVHCRESQELVAH